MLLKEIKTLEDVDIVKSFYYDIFPEEPNYNLADFINSVTGNHNYNRLEYYFALSETNDIIGFCGIYSNNKDEAWMGWFGIKPQFRRKGYARQMLHVLINKMKDYGYKIIRLYTDKKLNNNAYNLYISEGFIEDNQYEYDFVTMFKFVDNRTQLSEQDVQILKWDGVPLGFESESPHHCS